MTSFITTIAIIVLIVSIIQFLFVFLCWLILKVIFLIMTFFKNLKEKK